MCSSLLPIEISDVDLEVTDSGNSVIFPTDEFHFRGGTVDTSSGPRYVDHPAPSVVLVVLLMLSVAAVLFALPTVTQSPGGGVFPLAATAVVLLILCFYFWPIYKTYYTLSPEGILVEYGPWKRLHPWSDFSAAYWRKGMFASRIGWPSITPCVRLTNAVHLKRKRGWFPLYLTPNDPKAFLHKITEFAPDLTRETIL